MLIEDAYPVSPIQHAMLVHSLSAPDSGVYVQQLVAVLHEELNVSAFQRSWEKLVRRHAVLRGSLLWGSLERRGGRVHRDVLVGFECLEWSGCAGQEAQLEKF